MKKQHVWAYTAVGAETKSDVLAGTLVAKVPDGRRAKLMFACCSTLYLDKVTLKVGDKILADSSYVPKGELRSDQFFFNDDVRPGETVSLQFVHAAAGSIQAVVVIEVT